MGLWPFDPEDLNRGLIMFDSEVSRIQEFIVRLLLFVK
jgi:hypothetical protein